MARTIRKGDTTFRVADDDDYRDFWDWYETTDWEPDTVAVFERFLRPAMRYVDLGAWIGPTVLLAAAAVARVDCVEPDPVAREALQRNLDLNPEAAAKTAVFDFAVAADDGTAVLSAPGPGGQSLSSLVSREGAEQSWVVRTVGAETFFSSAAIEACDFVKIDVEGAEYEFVPRMERVIRSRRPAIYLSTHPNFLFDKASVWTRVRSGSRALRLNRRMLRVLLTYRHHYVYDGQTGRLKDVRRQNLLRVLFPLPLRQAVLIGACLFTDETADDRGGSGRRWLGRRGTPEPAR